MKESEKLKYNDGVENIYTEESATARESLSGVYEQMFETESFEESAQSLEDIGAMQDWRERSRKSKFGSFYSFYENISRVNKSKYPVERKKEIIRQTIEAAGGRVGNFSPRVADFYSALLAETSGEQYETRFEETFVEINELREGGDLFALVSEDVSWKIKLNRMDNRLEGFLRGARALDRRDGRAMDDDVRKWREEELKKFPAHPPARKNESKPGVDPMERLKEGERAPAIWSILPAYGGYYKEQSFSKWNNERNVWLEDEYDYFDVVSVPLCEKEDLGSGLINLTMRADVPVGQWVNMPVPYTHSFHKIEVGTAQYHVKKDQNGDLALLIEGEIGQITDIKVTLVPDKNKIVAGRTGRTEIPNIFSEFSEETNKKLEEIKNKKRGNISRARTVASYVRSRIRYLAPKDYEESARYNNIYNTHQKGFAGAVDEIKAADCDVANTYFAALCAKLSIPVRHCVGHSVRGKDDRGAASIHSGTGHGWSEVWDEINLKWERIDATPPGDRQLEDEKETGTSLAIPGDYGEQEAIGPTDEELERLHQKLAEHTEKLSYTREERELAEAAGVEFKEARKIVKEINIAENTRLPNGELVVDLLARLFNAIVESRKATISSYDGPVRQREGGEAIEDIIRHKIGISAGDMDPMSREKPSQETKEEQLIGGFDLYIIGDKSGSMQNTVEAERLWEMQRRAEYLIFSSLHRFERNIERAGLQKKNSLSVRTQGISFRGGDPDDIDLDKSLSANFSSQDKVTLWNSLTKRGSANGDVAALSHIYEQIKGEIREVEKRGSEDNRLRLIIACSDGGPDNPAGVKQLAEDIGRLNAVVVGMGLTETAAAVPIIYDTPYSRGDIARDINDLPALVAKHLILEAIKLFPAKAQDNAKRIIESALDKFKNIK